MRIETGWPHPNLSPNARVHHMVLYRHRKAAKKEAYWATCYVKPRGYKHGNGRLKLTIRAHPPVKRDRDDDNLISSLKGHLDGIAEALGVDDSLFDLQPVRWEETNGRGMVIFEVEAAA